MATVTVSVERMAPEGESIARPEGASRIVFVPYGVPGDRLEVELHSEKSTFARGRIKSLLTPGPERIEPPCPLHFRPTATPAPACGGCDWQQLAYEAQLKHKRLIISDCLARIAKLRDFPVEPVTPSPQAWGYRNKTQIPFAAPAPGSTRPTAGFYAAGSHEIVDMEDCPVQPELSVRILRKVKDLSGTLGWSKNPTWLRHLYVRTNASGSALAALVTKTRDFPGPGKRDAVEKFLSTMREAFPELVSLYQNVQPQDTSVIFGPNWFRLWGRPSLSEKIGRYTFSASPSAFLQVNTPAAALLYDAALAALNCGGKTWGTVLDLYCGVGTLSVWTAGSVGRVIGIEENRDAVRDAYRNAEANGIKNARFSAGRVEAILSRALETAGQGPLAALVDPPRAGLSVPVLRGLTRPALRRLVYLSCDPATFARDVGFLTRSGYRLIKATPIDLFPQTSHVELVGLLER